MSASVDSTPVNEKDDQAFQEFKLLNAVNDRYGGVVMEVTEPIDSALFSSIIRASISQWRHQVFFLPSYFFRSQFVFIVLLPSLKLLQQLTAGT